MTQGISNQFSTVNMGSRSESYFDLQLSPSQFEKFVLKAIGPNMSGNVQRTTRTSEDVDRNQVHLGFPLLLKSYVNC